MIIEWWNSLNITEQIFYCIAVPSTLVLLIQTIMMFLGLGDDGNADGVEITDTYDSVPEDLTPDAGDGVFGEDSVSEPDDSFGMQGLRIFTLRGIVAFLVVFGWLGVVLEGAGVALWLNMIISSACGFGIMLVLAFLLRAIMRLRSDGNTDNRNAVGTSGKVYLTVPPSRSGEGKVQIMLQGSYVERNAVTDDTSPIPTGSEIVVVGVSGQTDLVVRRK